ncbi:MAG: hypothetical protein H5T91_02600 [Synergistetes bacterium]|nr:MAG: putative septum site-determining protein MinC [bacterium 42_11]MBC7331310.1 hypothetical protein [Synergistota bacterium]MDK2871260.1 septum site-determining protein MinC [bacterium]
MEAIKVKGAKGGIRIIIDDKASWKEVVKELKEKLSLSFFDKGKVFLELGYRRVTEKEYEAVDKLFEDKPYLKLIGVEAFDPFTRDVIRKYLPQIYPVDEGRVSSYFHMGTLRSGSSLQCDGSLVVIGDINPGAEVKVGGNLVVFGALRGSVYVGMNSHEKDIVVAALKLSPSLLVMKNKVISLPSEFSKGKPALVVLSGDQVSFQLIRGG